MASNKKMRGGSSASILREWMDMVEASPEEQPGPAGDPAAAPLADGFMVSYGGGQQAHFQVSHPADISDVGTIVTDEVIKDKFGSSILVGFAKQVEKEIKEMAYEGELMNFTYKVVFNTKFDTNYVDTSSVSQRLGKGGYLDVDNMDMKYDDDDEYTVELFYNL